MGLCVLEGSGGSSGLETVKEKWAELNIAYVDKNFYLGANGDINVDIPCSMEDVLPNDATLVFAVYSSSNSTRGGSARIVSITGKTVIVRFGYSYSDGVYVTIRGYYMTSNSRPFEIKSVTHYFDPGNVMGDSQSSKDMEFSMDAVLPADAVIVGYGFRSFVNATGRARLKNLINRTPIVTIGYSYNQTIEFTMEAFYI